MDPVQSACEAFLDRCRAPLLVGFSGGLDSTVLLHGLRQCLQGLGDQRSFRALHVNHHLHADSDRWAVHCAAVAAELDVPFVFRDCTVGAGSNLEARARAARYEAFGAELGAGEALTLAHHADDRLETRLLHLFQGRGLYGLPAERAFARGRLVRPLLDLPRHNLEAYAGSHRLRWIDDPGNADSSLDRNFLRHQIVPALEARYPGLDDRLGRLEATQAGLASVVDERLGLDREPLPLAVFQGLGTGARLAVLRRWLTLKAPAAGVSDGALREFLRQLDAANDRQPSLAVGGRTLRRYRGALYLAAPAPTLEGAFACSVPGSLTLPHGDLELSAADAPGVGRRADDGLCVQLEAPISVTFAGSLEVPPRLELSAGRGRFSKTLKALFAEAGVPPWQRPSWPLIVDRHGLAAVAGIAVRRLEPAAAGTGESVEIRWRPRPAEPS